MALGQNDRAAYFSGIPVKKVETGAYLLSGILAAITGLLIYSRVGGAYLGMGDSYQMDTIGTVVIGGTLISGGKASAFGTLLGCFFFSLISTFMQLLGISSGLQQMIKGLLIIIVMIAGAKKKAAE